MHKRIRWAQIRTQFSRESFGILLRLLLLAVGMNFTIEAMARHSIVETLQFMRSEPAAYAFGILLIFCTLTISLIFKRRRFAVLLISTVWLGIGIANFVVAFYRSMPITAYDIWLMSSVRDIFDMYLSHFSLALIMVGISVVLGAVIFLWMQLRKNRALPVFGGVSFLAALAIVLLLSNVLQAKGWLDQPDEFPNITAAYDENGVAYGFAASLVTRGVQKPDDYSEAEIMALTNEEEQLPETDTSRPNVILVQLESFFDPNYMQDLELGENPVPNFQALREEGISGLLSTPCIGAGTANTEFEVLSGMNLSHFGVGEYPYMTIANKYHVQTVAHIFRDLGYGTHAIHNNNATFYDRNLIYGNLGFDTFTSLEYMQDVEYNPLGWAEDAVLPAQIFDALASTEGRDLVFAISVQPHGKYPTEPVEGADLIAVEGMEDEGRAAGFSYYLSQLKDVDAMVGALQAAVAAYAEPTVVVFYGDHLPSFQIAQEELSYGDEQSTEYVIWANFDLEGEDRDLEAYQLSAYLMELCGIYEGSVFCCHQLNDYTDSEAYQEDLKLLEYDMIYGEAYALEGEAPEVVTEIRLGVREITLTGVEAEAGGCRILGENFTPFSTVTCNGDLLETQYISPTELYVAEFAPEPGDLLAVAQVSAADGIEILSTTAALEIRNEV
ncbi:MAG: LTA synthase family protein [Oscillospiraceae bacterium]|nr:LTA synthase family protein [Oscillospiraceae bacterium]